MRWVTGFLALVIATPAAAQQIEVTLNEAIKRALQVQPAMVQARGDQRNAGAGRRVAFGSFIPSLTLGGSAQRSSQPIRPAGDTTTTPAARYQYAGTLSAQVDLFAGFKRIANLRSANATSDASSAGVVNQRFQVTLLTKQAFYNAIATEELVRVAESQVRRAQQQLQISVDKLHAGSATRSDSLRSTVDYGNARIALLQAQANLATAQANLGRQIGADQPVRALPDSVLPPLPDTTGLRTAVIESAPSVRQADARARAASSQVGVSRAAYFPTLTYSAGNTFTGKLAPWDNTGVYSKGWNVRVSLNWTLFNGFTRERSMTSASVARDIAEAQAADTRRGASAQYTQQVAALQTAFAKLAITVSNVAATTEDLRVQQERYRVGAATILDLLTSQASLTQAQVNLVQSRFNFVIARAQLEAVLGRTL